MRILRHTNLHVILGAAFFAVAGNGVVAPIVGSLQQPTGKSLTELSYILTVFTGFVILFTPVFGLLADRYGRRKVLLPTILLFSTGALIPLTDSFATILIVRALQGVSVAGMASLAVTLIGDLYSGAERAQAMSFRTSAHSFGFAVSPFVAGALATIDVMYPFYLFALVIPLWLYAYIFLDRDHDNFGGSGMKYVRDIWEVCKRSETWLVFYSIFHVCVIFYVMLVVVPILLNRQYAMASFGQGSVLSYFFAMAALTSLGARGIIERFRDRHVLIASFVVFGLMMSALPFAHSLPLLLAFITLWGIAHGLSFTIVYVLASSLTPTRLRAGAVAGAFMVTYLGVTVSPPVFLQILAATGGSLEAVFISAGVFAVLPVLAALLGRYRIEGSAP